MSHSAPSVGLLQLSPSDALLANVRLGDPEPSEVAATVSSSLEAPEAPPTTSTAEHLRFFAGLLESDDAHRMRLGHVVLRELAAHPSTADYVKLDAALKKSAFHLGDAEARKRVGEQLHLFLAAMAPRERSQSTIWKELSEVCHLMLSDARSKTLMVQNKLASYGVLVDKPINADLASVSVLDYGPKAEIINILTPFINDVLIELLVEQPFCDAVQWTRKVMDVVAGALGVLDGQLRYAFQEDARADWSSGHRLLMATLWQTVSQREGSAAGIEYLQSLIWLDKHYDSRNSTAEKEAKKAAQIVETPAIAQAEKGVSLIVCDTAFPPSKDSDEKSFLQDLSVLRSPLPLHPMPTPEDLGRQRSLLQAEFPWAQNVIDRLFDQLTAKSILGCQSLFIQPVLLVGEPGAGKSRFVRRFAQLLKIVRLDIPLGGESDVRSLSGTARGYSTGRPNDMVMAMVEQKTATLCVALDEIDKSGSHDGASVHSFLLGLLEPETATNFRDSYLKVGCNLSTLIWMATANSLKPIPPALLSRFQVFHMALPTVSDHRSIAEGVLHDTAKDWQIERWLLPSIDDLALPWDALQSARDVRKAVVAAVTRHTIESRNSAGIGH